jgi:acetolactate synthase I/II/III large subunit
MRVSDYIAELLAANDIKHVFMVTGGGAMHLNDAFGRNKKLEVVCCHHEQACAMAAESYARLSGRLAAVNVTAGPGGINSLNGVYGAYTDSIGMIIISGQVKRETLVTSYDLPLRQLGDQEVDIIRMASPVCKFAVQLGDPADTRYLVEKALWLAKSGRPGPAWIDVPIDVQGAQIDPAKLRGFDRIKEGNGKPFALPAEANPKTGAELEKLARDVLDRLAKAKHPVIMPGTGIRISKSYESFLRVIEKLGVPVVTAFNAHDLLWDDHPLYAGRPGTVGDRAGNFAVQNSDFILILGCRLNIRQISYNWKSFAREAFKVMVDIDSAELAKPTLSIDLPVHADLAEFLTILERLPYTPSPAHADYVGWCKQRVKKYPAVLPEYWQRSTPVNPYCFGQALYRELGEGAITVTANATACVTTFQAAEIKKGQRLYSNSGSASMGYDVPAAIGAYYASGKPVICLAGEGSIMMNLQELQTVSFHKLPIKIFLLNNGGYSSIIQTQKNFFADNIVGCGPDSGVNFPDFSKLAPAFGFGYRRCGTHEDLKKSIRATLDAGGPQMLEVALDPNMTFMPKLSSRRLEDGTMVSSPLEDMFPFLSREELAQNMLIASPKT